MAKTDKLIKHLFEGLKQKGVNELTAVRKISEQFDMEATDVMNIVEGKPFRKDDKYGDEEKKKETFGDRQKRQSEKKKDKDNLNENEYTASYNDAIDDVILVFAKFIRQNMINGVEKYSIENLKQLNNNLKNLKKKNIQ
jgi:hypothetical protein